MQSGTLLRITKVYLSTVVMAGALAAYAAGPDMRLSGLALHQETGRSIYLGGIFFNQNATRPDDLLQSTGPRLMEYRVVARRTSIRSLLGGILLQSELANSRAPDENTATFASNILDTVQGSLYAGDTFEILLNKDNETVAYLNGQELARVADSGVADYILAGWAGQQGPSTAFRESITASEIDSSMLSAFEQSTYSQERAEQVAGWLPAQENNAIADTSVLIQEPTTATTVEPAAAAISSQKIVTPISNDIPGQDDNKKEELTIMPTAALAIDTSAKAANDPLLKQPQRQPAEIALPDKTQLDPGITEGTQVASLMPARGLLGTDQPEGVSTLNVQDYSQRLASFNTELIKRVYGEIQYPRQAVRRSLQGRLELDVTMLANGELADVQIARSSGHKILDVAAIKAARKALLSTDPADLDPVAVAEYRNEAGNMVIPVPVQFLLTE